MEPCPRCGRQLSSSLIVSGVVASLSMQWACCTFRHAFVTHFQKLNCNIEGGRPLQLTLTGMCVAVPPVREVLSFSTTVRVPDKKKVSKENHRPSFSALLIPFSGVDFCPNENNFQANEPNCVVIVAHVLFCRCRCRTRRTGCGSCGR